MSKINFEFVLFANFIAIKEELKSQPIKIVFLQSIFISISSKLILLKRFKYKCLFI